MNGVTVVLRQIATFCDRWHWVLLALAVPFLLFPSPSRSPALLVVPGLWLIAWLAGREPLPRTPLNATLLLMFVMVLVSTWATFDIAFSLPKISGMVLGVGLFYAVARESQQPRGWWLSFLLFLGLGLGLAGISVIGTKWTAKVTPLIPIVSSLATRITGLPGAEEGFHPNYVAGALLWVMPTWIMLSLFLLARAKDVRAHLGRFRAAVLILLTVAATLYMLGVFVLTQSRGGYLALVLVGLALFCILLPGRARWVFIGILLLGAILIALGIWQSGPSLFSQVVFGENPSSTANSALDSLEGRLELWSRAIYAIQDFPFTGMGMNTFRRVVHVLYPLFLISPDSEIGHAHNEYLQAGVDLGFPGLIAFVALYIGAFWMLWRIWSSAKSTIASGNSAMTPSNMQLKGWGSAICTKPFAFPRLVQILALGLGSGLLGHMIWGVTDAMALGARPTFWFWIVLGLTSGLHQQVQEK